MKPINLLFSILFLTLLQSCSFFYSEDLNKLKEIDLSEFNRKLRSEKIYFEMVEVTNNGVTENRINVIIINIKRKGIDLKEVNADFFKVIEKKNLKLKNYDKIKFWYYSKYDEAKLRILYIYNNKKELIDVSYR